MGAMITFEHGYALVVGIAGYPRLPARYRLPPSGSGCCLRFLHYSEAELEKSMGNSGQLRVANTPTAHYSSSASVGQLFDDTI